MTRLGRRWGLPAGVMAVAVALVVLSSLAVTHEAEAEPSCTDPGTALPVVIVHGFRSSAEEMLGLRAVFEDAAVDLHVETFDYEAYHSDWVDHPQIGVRLRQLVICLADASALSGGSGRVALVAHSMGGLAVRHALSSDVEGRGQLVDEVALVVTLGTPHAGSQWAGPSTDSKLRVFRSAVETASAGVNLLTVGRIPSVESPAGRALAVGSSQLTELSDFPQGVPVFASAGEFVGHQRFLFYSRTMTFGDVVVTSESATDRSQESSGLGGKDVVECHTDLPLELGPGGTLAAVDVARRTNPYFLDCFHTRLPNSPLHTREILTQLVVASGRPARPMSQIEVANAFYGAFLAGDAELARRFTLQGQNPDSFDVLERNRPDDLYLAAEVWSCWDLYCEFMDNVTPGWKLVVEPRNGRYVVSGVLHAVGHPVADWPEVELNEYCVRSAPAELHSGPGEDHPAMMAMPAGSCGVYSDGEPLASGWRPVRWNGRLGFADGRMLRPVSSTATVQEDLPSAPRVVSDFLAAWWRGDRATQERISLTGVAESFEHGAEGFAEYRINDDGTCGLNSAAEGSCTVTLIVPQGSGFAWRLYYRGTESSPGAVIADVESLGGGA